MKIHVDRDLCDNHGQCVFAAPEVFSFDDDDYLVYQEEAGDELHEKVAKAAAVCPVRAITFTGGPLEAGA
jgi:ferredoxin